MRKQHTFLIFLVACLFTFSPVSAAELRISTYNILADETHLFSPGTETALAEAIKSKQLDLAMFQEVLYPNPVSVNTVDEAIEIKKALDLLGYPMYLYRIRYPLFHEFRAMALFSKYPFSETGYKLLVGDRYAQMARVVTPFGYIRVINDHLQTENTQCQGFSQSIKEYGETFGDNVIFGGDMNTNIRHDCDYKTTFEKYLLSCTNDTKKDDTCNNLSQIDHIGYDRRIGGTPYKSYRENVSGISDHKMVVMLVKDVPERQVINPSYICDFDYNGTTELTDIIELIKQYFVSGPVITMCDADNNNITGTADIILNIQKIFK